MLGKLSLTDKQFCSITWLVGWLLKMRNQEHHRGTEKLNSLFCVFFVLCVPFTASLSVTLKKHPPSQGEDNDELRAMQSQFSWFPWGDPINCGPDKSQSREHYWLQAACPSVPVSLGNDSPLLFPKLLAWLLDSTFSDWANLTGR